MEFKLVSENPIPLNREDICLISDYLVPERVIDSKTVCIASLALNDVVSILFAEVHDYLPLLEQELRKWSQRP